MHGVHATTATTPHRGLARLDAMIIGLIVVLSAISLSVWYNPGFPGVVNARALDIAINVAAIIDRCSRGDPGLDPLARHAARRWPSTRARRSSP